MMRPCSLDIAVLDANDSVPAPSRDTPHCGFLPSVLEPSRIREFTAASAWVLFYHVE